MQVLSPDVYRKESKEIEEEARSKVHKYHFKTLEYHEKFLNMVESKDKQRTLFVIVADEAHIAITKGDKSNDPEGKN